MFKGFNVYIADKRVFFVENGLLTIKEYADIKGVSVQSVYKRVKAGLKDYCVEIDGKKYIRAEVLEQPEPEQQRETDEQPEPEKVYTADYVELLLEQIADLKAEKAMMQQRIDDKDAHIMEMHKNAEKHSQQMEEMRLKLDGVEKQLELMATQPEQTEIIIQPEPELQEEKEPEQPKPEPQPEKKKGFWARLFGGNS